MRKFIAAAFVGFLTFQQPHRVVPDALQAQSTFPPLQQASLEDVRSALAHGQITSAELVTAYLRRISQVNPLVNAITEISSDALEVANHLDRLRSSGVCLGPLHGVPVLVKDNIAVHGMNNTAGSTALLGAFPGRDAAIVDRLRKAGAIVLGKANLSQWANYRSSGNTSTHGWSATGGQTYGAFYPQQDPSGSSSGSAVAIALGLSTASIGTDTMGSIGSPAQKSSLVGIKPTMGLTSRDLVIPFSIHQDLVGPIARTVKDAAAILTAIAGQDDKDNYTTAIPFESVPDYAGLCKTGALNGARIGVPRASVVETPENRPMVTAFNASLQLLRHLGAEVIEGTNFATWKDDIFTRNASIVYALDFKTGLRGYLSQLSSNPSGIRDLPPLINYTVQNQAEQYPERDIALWEDAINLPYEDNTSQFFWEAYQGHVWHGTAGGVTGVLERYKLDAIILPTSVGNHAAGPAGLPVITVPMGFYPDDQNFSRIRGHLLDTAPTVPFGISFIGDQFSEVKLIPFAYDFEQNSETKSTRPYLQPNIELSSWREQARGWNTLSTVLGIRKMSCVAL